MKKIKFDILLITLIYWAVIGAKHTSGFVTPRALQDDNAESLYKEEQQRFAIQPNYHNSIDENILAPEEKSHDEYLENKHNGDWDLDHSKYKSNEYLYEDSKDALHQDLNDKESKSDSDKDSDDSSSSEEHPFHWPTWHPWQLTTTYKTTTKTTTPTTTTKTTTTIPTTTTKTTTTIPTTTTKTTTTPTTTKPPTTTTRSTTTYKTTTKPFTTAKTTTAIPTTTSKTTTTIPTTTKTTTTIPTTTTKTTTTIPTTTTKTTTTIPTTTTKTTTTIPTTTAKTTTTIPTTTTTIPTTTTTKTTTTIPTTTTITKTTITPTTTTETTTPTTTLTTTIETTTPATTTEITTPSTTTTTEPPSACPDGWILIGAHCYYFSTITANWYMSLARCHAMNSTLAFPTNRNENQLLKAYLQNPSTNQTKLIIGGWWTGGTDMAIEGEWVWVGLFSEIDYFDWYPNEPNNYGVENCLSYNPDTNYLWNDRSCNYPLFGFICQLLK